VTDRNKPRAALIELTITRFRLFFREPSALFWTFGFPVVLAVALGIAFRNRPPEPVHVAVQAGPGADHASVALASDLVKTTVEDEPTARRELRAGKVVLVVVPGEPRTYRYDETRPEARLARLKSEVAKYEGLAKGHESARREEEVAAEGAQLARDRAALDAERAAFGKETAAAQAKLKAESQALADLRAKLGVIRHEIEAGVKAREADVHRKEAALDAERAKLQESAEALARAEAHLSEQRAKMEAQMAALAAKEVMFEERHRQLQESMKHFVKA